MTWDVLVLPGDGIGPSVISSAVKAISAATDAVSFVEGELGQDAYEDSGQHVPHDTMDLMDDHRIVLCGPTAHVNAGQGGSPSDILRAHLGIYARLRAFRTLAPDLGVEGLSTQVWSSYNNLGRDIQEVPDMGGIAISKYVSSTGYQKMMELARRFIDKDGLRRIACLVRDDVFPRSSEMFAETFGSIFPSDCYETRLDNMCDWASHTICGRSVDEGLICVDLYSGMAESVLSGLTGADHLTPTVFFGEGNMLFTPIRTAILEDVPEGYENPTAGIVSASQILKCIGKNEESDAVVRALQETYAAGERTPDVGGELSAEEFTERVVSRIIVNPVD